MDKNFHLLTSDEIQALQTISTRVVDFNGTQFSFNEIRDEVDVIIVPYSYPEPDNQAGDGGEARRIYTDSLTEERAEIEEEITSLDPNRVLRERVEQGLPLPEGLPEEVGPDIDIVDLDGLLNTLKQISEKERQKDTLEKQDRMSDERRREWLSISEGIDRERERLSHFVSEMNEEESRFIRVYNLVKHLEFIDRELKGENNGEAGYFYCNMSLGSFSRARKGKKAQIFLFLDNIQRSVDYYNNNISLQVPQYGTRDRKDMIMEVFAHEMMHAYYSREKKVNFRLGCVPNVEEPMAEYGMLCFLKQFALDNYELNCFNHAFVNVKNKLPVRGLEYYGFGSVLYDVLNTRSVVPRTNPATLFYVFSIIGRVIYLQPTLYKIYCRAVLMLPANNTTTVQNACVRCLFALIQALIIARPDKSYNYLFDKRPYRYGREIVRVVINDYLNNSARPSFAQLQKDFDSTNRRIYGIYGAFINMNSITTSNQGHYDTACPLRFFDYATSQHTEIALKEFWGMAYNVDKYHVFDVMKKMFNKPVFLL